MYPWIWQHLPGPTAAKVVLATVLVGLVVLVLPLEPDELGTGAAVGPQVLGLATEILGNHRVGGVGFNARERTEDRDLFPLAAAVDQTLAHGAGGAGGVKQTSHSQGGG